MEKSKRNVSEKMLLQKQNKNNKKGDDKKNRFLISISFLGSAGPIRVVVNGDDLVSGIISTALKIYAREGRLPVLGFDASNFLLYCVNAASDGAARNNRSEGRDHSQKTIWLEGMDHGSTSP
ncbi:uncharacterized protein LOC18099384 isoform X2 [Populus trichocarpa]|uniref:uncharacterized protein LOC18099384 isoform X2 n=1 Tax=Populus trichocarpa TaxID=3694 RepID=UPI0022788079|nr:uncharacterized protein LOC18099384 isoform X2 [Populus trichocarpa]